MTLDPGFEQLLVMMTPFTEIDYSSVSVDHVRSLFDNPMPTGETIAMDRVTDMTIDLTGRTLPARLYVPQGAGDLPPLTVYFHGGGWVIGTIETHDATCRMLARESGAAVLSIGYRLAPEHPYPAAADDCFEATCWAATHADQLGIDGARVAVAGDSAGGNLAAAVAIMARDAGGPALCHQLLLYPVTDAPGRNASYVANGGGNYFLSAAAMQWFWDHYVDGRGADDAPLAAILRADNLSNLPSATIITAQYDPLKDEGDAYAARLAGAGVSVDAHCAPGMIHGFFGMFDLVPPVKDWNRLAGANLARSFGGR
jgi:acetyl esterase